ncbi:DgyrCDS13651 [Dimorphilus gyrociliatus]|uniref:porphobilinogen synthase n=1 Tax=Dimorphilus gyrociliatus TaxID=2664684 RepID=A0A7I8WBA3_9ANNE|nr:DgyrCDS13651 [Dimorphilus gyrociliatus]
MIGIVVDLKSCDFIVESIEVPVEESVAKSAEFASKMMEDGSAAAHEHGIVHKATRAIKEILLISAIARTQLMGIVKPLPMAEAGVDLVAHSEMMDGPIVHICAALDKNCFEKMPIIKHVFVVIPVGNLKAS